MGIRPQSKYKYKMIGPSCPLQVIYTGRPWQPALLIVMDILHAFLKSAQLAIIDSLQQAAITDPAR